MLESQKSIEERIGKIGIIPAVKLQKTEDAVPLAHALMSGNLPAAEITFQEEGTDKVIAAMKKAFPELLIGAGTVFNVRQVELAISAGAQFITCPGYDEMVATYCIYNNIPIFPGCATPTEIQKALKDGLKVIKFFPAVQYGGLETINVLSESFPNAKFIPTGGISLNNLEEYMSSRHVAACGGSFITHDSLIKEKNWAEVTRLSVESIKLVNKARGYH